MRAIIQKILSSQLVLSIVNFALARRQSFFVALLCVLAMYVFLILLSYDKADPAWSHAVQFANNKPIDVSNLGGATGAFLSDVLYLFFGYGAWAMLCWLAFEMMSLLSQNQARILLPMRILAYAFLWLCVCVLLSAFASSIEAPTLVWGGVFGQTFYEALSLLLTKAGAVLFAVVGVGVIVGLVLDVSFLTSDKNAGPLLPLKRMLLATVKTPSSDDVATFDDEQVVRHQGIFEHFLRHSDIVATLDDDVAILTGQPKESPKSAAAPIADVSHISSQKSGWVSKQSSLGQTDALSKSSPKPFMLQADNKTSTTLAKETVKETLKDAFSGIVLSPAWDKTPHQDNKTPSQTFFGQATQAVQSSQVLDSDPLPAHKEPVKEPPINLATPARPDAHDERFAQKSFAMQTAAYRATLSPIPSLELLDPKPMQQVGYSPRQLQELSELLEIKLKEFGVNASVMNVVQGPIVTSFEVQLAAGVKASKVTGIAQDLARSLSMVSLRVVEVIAGKPYIGIEIPNKAKETVKLIELLGSHAYQKGDNQIAMAMGKDIGGNVVIADLAKAPHMLVAGTTGSGKSVLVNAMLLSMLLKYTPDELRLILIDPKMLELANYGDIPHLLTPVVTDMTEAASALSWCVGEMERRYQLMALLKVRKISEFNKKVKEAENRGEPLLDPLWRKLDSVSQDKPPKLKPLPLIVVVADEFADMIMQVGKQAEELITRLAQKSRAAGIHLVLATQRPSVDVITGLIKANIPSRAALRVNSKVDSRTILDAGGAEDMLGHGDMLFLAPGKNEPIRVHGAYVSDEEVNRVTDAWRERGAPDYIDTVTSSTDYLELPKAGEGLDELYEDAVMFVMESGKTSISAIQRELRIGYNRAANLVDEMERQGILSKPDHSGKRTLLS